MVPATNTTTIFRRYMSSPLTIMCRSIFRDDSRAIYLPDEPPTALCPYCHIDAVIGDASGFPITEEFLTEMMRRWFG